jgi:predicted ATP-grasp superfamily ATP-dependent carboligase
MSSGPSPSAEHRVCALVLSGHVNGYSIVQELHAEGVEEIVLFDTVRRFGAESNKIRAFREIEDTAEALREALRDLNQSYQRIVIFPTHDSHLVYLHAIRDQIGDFCFIPFNPDNVLPSLDKSVQYRACEELGVPYPRSRYLSSIEDYDGLLDLPFPVVLKPESKTLAVFRPFLLESPSEHRDRREEIRAHFSRGMNFLSSEVIPGDGSNIYAYVAFRSHEGEILNEWSGKKLSQHPNEFGVFASASNQAPQVVAQQGRRLVEGMNLHGIAEPEFKYDARDGRYKLMEVNLRSMMWHRVGHLSGVPLHYTQYLYATRQPVPRHVQNQKRVIHFIFLNHEVNNLLNRKGYRPTLSHVFRGGDQRVYAFYDRSDLRPFADTIWMLCKQVMKKCLRR